MERKILDEQIEYYRQRAGEYDEWFLRQGRYDRGEAHTRQWFGEVAQVEAALRREAPLGHVLELACGTGLWTQRLALSADRITAVDASPEAIALNRQRLGDAPVTYIEADLFQWQPQEKYDFVFFSFWLSHVPADRFMSFWKMVRAALRPDGRAFFIDSRFDQTSTARDHAALRRDGYAERILNDGRHYRIVKVFYEPDDLALNLHVAGWWSELYTTENYFIYGTAHAGGEPPVR